MPAKALRFDPKLLLAKLLAGDLTAVLTRYSDILLAVLVMAIVGILIVPLPPFLLDLLLATSVTLSMTVLMITLYVPNALALASFPTLILVATLLRLSLNMASTKLILLEGYAGEVIEAFGEFVVQGDFIVGFVVFTLVTIIQFVVIAKGAERVSEVSARFTLDALPGKQMSIDADLRAGLLDAEEARAKRDLIGRESQFYGAMDGAMKFVKGDTIMGIIISVINIVAGLGIGVLAEGMAVGDAARQYTLLTVGDGLVSQIPSLILATAAGIITTRVASTAGEQASLGEEIGTQILAQPKAIAITACLLFGLGLLPGLPFVPFFVLALLAATFAWGILRTRRRKDRDALRAEVMDEAAQLDGSDQRRLPVAVPVVLETGAEITPLLDVQVAGTRFVQEMIPRLRDWLFQEYGVQVPGVRVRGDVRRLEANAYAFLIHEVPVASGKVWPGRVFVTRGVESLVMLNADAVDGRDPETGARGLWIREQDAERWPDITQGSALACDEMIARHLAEVLRQRLHELLGVQDVQAMLDLLESQGYAALVHTLVPDPLSVQRLTDVLRRLLAEDLSIRNMPAILEALSEAAALDSDAIFLTQQARANLGPHIAHRFGRGLTHLPVLLIDPRLEQALRSAVRPSEAGRVLRLPPNLGRGIFECFEKALKASAKSGERPIILTQGDIRHFVRSFLAQRFPSAVVLAFQELPASLRIQPKGRVLPSEAVLRELRELRRAA